MQTSRTAQDYGFSGSFEARHAKSRWHRSDGSQSMSPNEARPEVTRRVEPLARLLTGTSKFGHSI